MTVNQRRRPVPRAWREENHWLDVWHRRHYAAMRGGGYYSRAGGRCSCGQTFGLAANDHTLDTDAVKDRWLDHVENAYYQEVAV